MEANASTMMIRGSNPADSTPPNQIATHIIGTVGSVNWVQLCSHHSLNIAHWQRNLISSKGLKVNMRSAVCPQCPRFSNPNVLASCSLERVAGKFKLIDTNMARLAEI